MKNVLLIILAGLLFSCSKVDETPRLMYDINYTVVTTNGAIINQVEYRDDKGDLITLTDVTSPWSIDLRVRAGLGLEATAFGDIPYQGSISITGTWTPDGGSSQSETETLGNSTPGSTINNGRVEISGRTLPG